MASARRGARRLSAAALLAALAAAPAPAAGGERAPDAALEPLRPAIARLNHAGFSRRQHCTAVLVGPRTVATAAHCVAGIEPEDMHVLTGYDRVEWIEHLRPVSAHLADDGRDVAVLCLAEPSAARPVTVSADAPAPGERLVAAGYGRPAVHRLTAAACPVAARGTDGRVRAACTLAGGASGGPVLRIGKGGAEVLAIVSRSGERGSLFEPLRPADVAGRCGPATRAAARR
jgi:protease YdgD